MKLVSRTCALLQADHRHNGSYIGNLNPAHAAKAEYPAARENFSAANADLRAAKSGLQKAGNEEQVSQAKKNEK